MATPDWMAILALASRQGVAPLLAHRLLTDGNRREDLGEVRPRLERLRTASVMRDLQRLAAYRDLVHACRIDGLPIPVALKGLDLALTVYPVRGVRSMSDIDLLVPREAIPAVVAAAQRCGFTSTASSSLGLDLATAHHITPMARHGVLLEIHWRLFDPSLLQDGSDPADLLARARPLTCDGVDGRGLAPVDVLLHVAAHASYQHLAEQRLRAVWDVAVIVERFRHDWDWADVVRRAHQWRVARGTALMLALARDLAGSAVSDEVLTSLVPDGIPPGVVVAAREQIDRPALPPIGIHVTRLAAPDRPLVARLRHLVSRSLLVDQAVLAEATHDRQTTSLTALRERVTRPWALVSTYARRLGRLRRGDRAALRSLATRRNDLERWLSGRVD